MVRAKNTTYSRMRAMRTGPSVQSAVVIVEQVEPLFHSRLESLHQISDFGAPEKKNKRRRKAEPVRNIEESESSAFEVSGEESDKSSDEEDVPDVIKQQREIQNINKEVEEVEDFSLVIMKGDVRVQLWEGGERVHPNQPVERIPEVQTPEKEKKKSKRKTQKNVESALPSSPLSKFRQSIFLARLNRESVAPARSFLVFEGSNKSRIVGETEVFSPLKFSSKVFPPEVSNDMVTIDDKVTTATEKNDTQLAPVENNTSFAPKKKTFLANFMETCSFSEVFGENDNFIASTPKTSKLSSQFLPYQSILSPIDKPSFVDSPVAVFDKNRGIPRESQGRSRCAESSISDLFHSENVGQGNKRSTSKRRRTGSDDLEVFTAIENISTLPSSNEESSSKKETEKESKSIEETTKGEKITYPSVCSFEPETTCKTRNATLESLLQDVSLDDFLRSEKWKEVDVDRSQFKEITLGACNETVITINDTNLVIPRRKRESSMMSVNSDMGTRAATAMSILVDENEGLPFYLADMSLTAPETSIARLLHVIGQKTVLKWSELPKDVFKKPLKLGEGTYGEVFGTTFNKEPIALKIVPIEEDSENRGFDGRVNGEYLPDAHTILPEVIASRELSKLNDLSADHSTPNFITLTAINVVKGVYPPALLKAWDTFAKKEGTLNDRPTEYTTAEQRFITFAYANGGRDLEKTQLKNEAQMFSVLVQLCLALSVAEKQLEFEHRDLHLGNVLVQEYNEDLMYRYNMNNIVVKSHGVKTNIIDFTLSRMRKSQGDYQYDIYRMMKQENGNNWVEFHPKTNCFWIHFLATKMLQAPICPKSVKKKRKQELEKLFASFLKFESLEDSLMDSDFYNAFYSGYVEVIGVD
ncbi:unnamed protein product [Caenorhabditis auriculariae]|uniref:non-specific serine/threonine protein kinase n=1 Tax=Caenorhabditis auriculariae TaxID=2777116 RepID=A0A8S1H9V7_9PELO|nr:unnamed protein product [Caenorhabditis auriculariae]